VWAQVQLLQHKLVTQQGSDEGPTWENIHRGREILRTLVGTATDGAAHIDWLSSDLKNDAPLATVAEGSAVADATAIAERMDGKSDHRRPEPRYLVAFEFQGNRDIHGAIKLLDQTTVSRGGPAMTRCGPAER